MPRINHMDAVIAALPAAPSEIIVKAGVSNACVLKWLRILHDCKWIHIARWKRHPRAGPPMPVYAVGCKPDAICDLKHQTKQETRERFTAKAKADGRYDLMQAKWRNRWWKKKAASVPNTWLGALMSVTNQTINKQGEK